MSQKIKIYFIFSFTVVKKEQAIYSGELMHIYKVGSKKFIQLLVTFRCIDIGVICNADCTFPRSVRVPSRIANVIFMKSAVPTHVVFYLYPSILEFCSIQGSLIHSVCPSICHQLKSETPGTTNITNLTYVKIHFHEKVFLIRLPS